MKNIRRKGRKKVRNLFKILLLTFFYNYIFVYNYIFIDILYKFLQNLNLNLSNFKNLLNLKLYKQEILEIFFKKVYILEIK